MTTKEVIEAFNNFKPGNDDFDNLSDLSSLGVELLKNKDAHLGFETVFKTIEKYSKKDLLIPGLVAYNIKNSLKKYGQYLFQSLSRKPTCSTLDILNDIIEKKDKASLKRKEYINQLQQCITHPKADESAKEKAKQLYTLFTMSTTDIINALNNFESAGDESIDLEYLNPIIWQLIKKEDAHLACDALINIFERNSEAEFGAPGSIVHTLEDFPGTYEKYLFESLERKPAYMTLIMFERIINEEKNNEQKKKYLNTMKSYINHPYASQLVKEQAKSYYDLSS